MENRKVLIENFKLRIGNLDPLKTIPYMGIIVLSVIARLIPHPANFAPIGGLALFSGAHFKDKRAILLPLLAMLFSDFFLGFHNTMVFVYGSFILIYLIGRFLQKNRSFIYLLLSTLLSSLFFFFITNFGVWLMSGMYVHNFNGLINAYFIGIPFFRNTLLGDAFYSFSFFYGYQYLQILSHKFSSVKLNQPG